MNIGFALITAGPFFDQFVAVENRYHDECGFHVRLGLENNIPHTTLFQGTFRDDVDYVSIADKIAARIISGRSGHSVQASAQPEGQNTPQEAADQEAAENAEAQEAPLVRLHFDKVVYVPSGWYFYTCTVTSELRELHYYTLDLCKDFIVLNPDRMNRSMSDLTQEQIAGIRDYGYRYAGKAFFPHITIGRTSAGEQPEITQLLSDAFRKLPVDVPVDRLTVYEMGPDGTHARTFYECIL